MKRGKQARTVALPASDLEALRRSVRRRTSRTQLPRWNASPEDAQKSVAKLVLSLVEFLRKLMERQAIRRMEEGTLSPAEIESVGTAIMRLEETVRDMAERFGIDPGDLEIDLGPLGKLG
jgi:hypothetical protein